MIRRKAAGGRRDARGQLAEGTEAAERQAGTAAFTFIAFEESMTGVRDATRV